MVNCEYSFQNRPNYQLPVSGEETIRQPGLSLGFLEFWRWITRLELSFSDDRGAMHHCQCLIICLFVFALSYFQPCLYWSTRDDLPSYWCKHLENSKQSSWGKIKYEGSLVGKLYEWFLQASIRKQVLNIPNPYSAALFRSNQIWSIDSK